nr:DNA integrity scanning protein DisA nucleotide-binding domain protein [Flexilinea sp.]
MLAARNHGALIVMQRYDDLEKFIETGVYLNAVVSPELLLQIFYPNTPLHDGAVIVRKGRIEAAACVMPLSSRNVLDKTPGRSMGLRHRAALGTSEANDSITVVVSEESGTISVAFEGKITREISSERLKSMLENVYEQPEETPFMQRVGKFFDFIEKFLLGGEKK